MRKVLFKYNLDNTFLFEFVSFIIEIKFGIIDDKQCLDISNINLAVVITCGVLLKNTLIF